MAENIIINISNTPNCSLWMGNASHWTIFINDKQWATLGNKSAAKSVFNGMLKSLWQYLCVWVASVNK